MESGLLPPSQHKHAGAEGERVSSPSRGGLSPAASGQSAESLSPRGSCALPLVSSRPSTSLATFSPSLAFSGCSAEATADRREAGAPEGAALCLGWTWEEAEVHAQDFLFFLNQERTCRFLFVVELELSLFLAKIASHRLKALRVHARLIRRQLATVRGSARDLARRTPASQGGKETQGEHRLEAERREGEAQDATATSAGLSRHDGDAGGGGGRMADCDRGEGRQSVVDLGRGGQPLPAASSEFASCGLSALDQASARSLRLHACGCECCPRLRCTYTLEFPPLSPLLRRLIHVTAHRFGFSTQSQGWGEERFVVVTAAASPEKTSCLLGRPHWPPPISTAESPLSAASPGGPSRASKSPSPPPCPSPEGPTSTESAQPPSRRVSLSSSAERQQPRGLAGAPKKEICSAVRGGRGDLGPACAPADAALPTFLSNASTKEQCCWGDVVTGGGDAGRERIRCSALDASVVFGEIASPALSYEDFIPGLGALAADYERRKKREAEEKLERDEGQPSRRERGPQRPHGTESGALSDARREGKTPDSSPRLPASPGRGAAPTEEARGEKSRKCGKKDAREIAARQYPAHSALGSVCDSLDGLAREETPKKGREGSKSRGEDDEAGDEEGERQNGKKTDAPSSRAWLSLKDVMQDVERGKVEIIHLVLLRRAVKTGIRETLAALAHARQDMHALHLATRAELRDLASRPEATDERLWREGGGKQETETANGMQVEPGSQGGDGDTPGETRGRLGAAGGGGPETPERRGKASETQRKEDGLAPRQATSSSSASTKSTRGASPSAQNSGSLRGPAELGARDCEAGDAAQLKRTEGTETARPLTEKQSTARVAGVRRGRGFHHYSPGGTQTAGCVGGGWTPPSSRPLSPSASPLSSASASRSSASNSASSASLVCRGGVEPHVDAKEDAPPSPGAHRGRLETVRGAARAGHQAAGDPRGPGDPGAAAEEAATQSRGKAHEPADARLHPQRAKPVCERAESQGAGARRGTARRGHPIHAGLASGPPPGGAVEDKGGTASDDLEEDEEEAEEDVYALRPLFCYNAFSPPPKTWGGFRSPGTHVQPFCSLCLPPPPVAASSASSFPSRHAPPASPASHRAAAAFARLTYHPSWVFPEVQALREESAALTAEQAPRGGGALPLAALGRASERCNTAFKNEGEKKSERRNHTAPGDGAEGRKDGRSPRAAVRFPQSERASDAMGRRSAPSRVAKAETFATERDEKGDSQRTTSLGMPSGAPVGVTFTAEVLKPFSLFLYGSMDFPQASSAAPAWSPLPSSPSGGAPRASSSPASSLSSSSALTPPRRVAKNPVREGAVALLVFDFFPDDAGEGWNVRVSSHMSARLPRVHPALSACPSSSKEGDVEAAGEEDGTEAGTRENASPGARPSTSGGASLHAREEEGGSASHDGERPRGVAEDRLSRGEECRGTEGGSTEASSPGGTTRRGRRKGGKDRRGDAVSSPRHEGEGRDVKITGEALERSERKPRLEDASRWILAPSVRVRTSQELAAAWAQGRWPASVSAASLTSSLHSNAEWDGAVQAGANASDTNAPKHLELGGLNDREPSDPCSPRPRLSTPPPAPASGGVCGAQHIAGASPFSVAVSASPHAFLSSSPRCASSFADAAWFRFPYAHDRRDSRAESARAGSRVSLWLAQYPLSVSFPPPPSESSLRSCPSPPAESLPVASLCTSPVAHAPGCLLLLGRDRVFPLNIVAEVSAQLPLRESPSLQGLRARLAAVPSMCFSSFGFGVPPPPLHSPGTAGPAGDLLASGSAATASACSLCGPPRGEKTPRARNARGGAGETPPNRGEATEAADVRETGEGGGPLAERADPSDYGLEAAPRQDARARRADDSAQDKREDELWREKALLVSSRLATGSLMAFRAAAAAAASASSATGAPSPPASRFAGTKRRRSKADEEGAGDGDGQGEDGAAVPAGCTRRAASRDRRADTRGARNGQVGCEAGNGKAAGDPREANEDSAHAHRANRDLETGGREEGGTRRKQEVSRQAASPETGEARGGDGSAATERGDEARPARAEPETAPVERERNVCLARGARDILARLWRRGDQKAVCAECVSSGAILGGSCPRHHVIRGLFAFERFTSLAQEEDAPGMATRRGMPFPALAARDHILELSFCLAGSGGLAGDEEAKDTEDRLGETGERRECCCCCGDARGAEAGTTAKSGSGRDGRNGDLSRGVERPVAALVSSFSSFRSAAPLLGARFHAACLMRLLSEFVKGEPSGDPREAKWKESRGGNGSRKGRCDESPRVRAVPQGRGEEHAPSASEARAAREKGPRDTQGLVLAIRKGRAGERVLPVRTDLQTGGEKERKPVARRCVSRVYYVVCASSRAAFLVAERIHQWVETCAGQATANKAPSMRHEKGRSDSSSVEEQRGCDAEENTASGRGEIAATAEKGTGSREESTRNDKQKTEIDRQRACGVKASAHRASDEAASENPDRREAAKEKTAKRGKEKKTTRGEGENGDAETREDLGPAGEPLEAKEKEPQDEETVGRQRASEARSGVQDLETGLLGSLRVLSLAGVGIPLPSACTPWLDAARSSRRKHGAAAHSSSILPSSPSPPSSSLRPSHASPPTPSLAVLPPPAVGSAGNVPPASASGPSVCPAQSASAASAPSAMTVGGYVGGGDRARWLSLLRACAASTVREWGLCEALDRLADSEVRAVAASSRQRANRAGGCSKAKRRVPASASSGKKAETEREKRTREDRAPAAEDEPEGDASGDAESVTKRHMKERSREEGEDKACAQEEDDSEADEDCEEKADAGGEARPFLRLEIASATRMIARGLPPSAERNALLYRHRRGGEAEQEKARSGTLKLSGAL